MQVDATNLKSHIPSHHILVSPSESISFSLEYQSYEDSTEEIISSPLKTLSTNTKTIEDTSFNLQDLLNPSNFSSIQKSGFLDLTIHSKPTRRMSRGRLESCSYLTSNNKHCPQCNLI